MPNIRHITRYNSKIQKTLKLQVSKLQLQDNQIFTNHFFVATSVVPLLPYTTYKVQNNYLLNMMQLWILNQLHISPYNSTNDVKT